LGNIGLFSNLLRKEIEEVFSPTLFQTESIHLLESKAKRRQPHVGSSHALGYSIPSNENHQQSSWLQEAVVHSIVEIICSIHSLVYNTPTKYR